MEPIRHPVTPSVARSKYPARGEMCGVLRGDSSEDVEVTRSIAGVQDPARGEFSGVTRGRSEAADVTRSVAWVQDPDREEFPDVQKEARREDGDVTRYVAEDQAPDRNNSHVSCTCGQLCGFEIKMTLPIYTGKAEWRTFWLQFERITRRYKWSEDITLDWLVSTLRDDALEYYA